MSNQDEKSKTEYEDTKNRKNEATRYQISGNKRVAYCGVFTALALVLSYLESLVPVFVAVPGVKLGIANAVTIIALRKLSVRDASVISGCRIVLAGILFGNPVTIVYSLAGAFLSIIIMVAVSKLKVFTVTGISVCGGVAHNAGQLIVAALLLENGNIMYYMTVLAISGVISGTVIGILTGMILKKIRLI